MGKVRFSLLVTVFTWSMVLLTRDLSGQATTQPPQILQQLQLPQLPPATQKPATKSPVSTNVALYAFLRATAADDSSTPIDLSRSSNLIGQIGLTDKDRETLTKIFKEYATSLRKLHDPKAPPPSTTLQYAEISLYDHVIRRLRAELSPSGLEQLRAYLEKKKQKMEIHYRGEKQ